MGRRSTVVVADKSQEATSNESQKRRYYDRKDITSKAIQIFYTDGLDITTGISFEYTSPCSFFGQILHPNGTFRRFFDFLTVAWVLYCVFIVPFQVGFDWYIMSKWEKAIMNILDIWFAIDILLNFRTGFISHGTVVMHPRRIAK
jgi:hypothetical protein